MPNTREKLEVIAHLGDHITYKEGIGICYDSTLAKVIEDAYMTLKNGVTVQEWISVKDRLPGTQVEVLTYSECNGVRSACLLASDDKTTMWYLCRTDKLSIAVTHWMPLPKPPKGE